MMVAGIDSDTTRQDRNHNPDDPKGDNFKLAGRRHSVVLVEAKIRRLLFARRRLQA
jgi:hypothetical protein